MPDLRAYARDAATRAGTDPDTFVRQIQQESGFNPDAFNSGSGATGIAQIVPRWHPGVDPTDPIASLDYAAKLMADYLKAFGDYRKALAAYNWGSGNVGGYTRPDGVVVPPWDGERATLPAETRQYLDVILGVGWPEPVTTAVATGQTVSHTAVAYNADAPVDAQPDAWSCSIQSAQWLLRSLGRNPSRAWLEQQLVAPLGQGSIVTCEYGLMDANGRQMTAWLQREYGDDMGVTFDARPVATWEDLVTLASAGGLMLGGRSWNHWTGVRGYRDGAVLLANPAGSWKGVGQEMTRDEFDALGSWTAIVPRLPIADDAPPGELADVRRRLNDAVSALGYASGDLADAADAIAQSATALANTLRSLKPPAV